MTRKDFEVLDNRDGAQGLEIEEDGAGKWVVRNKKTGRIVYSKTKKDAEFLATKDGAANWDYGEGDVIEVETTKVSEEEVTELTEDQKESLVEKEPGVEIIAGIKPIKTSTVQKGKAIEEKIDDNLSYTYSKNRGYSLFEDESTINQIKI